MMRNAELQIKVIQYFTKCVNLCYMDTGTGIGYADTHFLKKHRYEDMSRIINNYI